MNAADVLGLFVLLMKFGAILRIICGYEKPRQEFITTRQSFFKVALDHGLQIKQKNIPLTLKIMKALFFFLLLILFSNRKIQATPEDLKEYVICRYYDEKAEVMDRNEKMTKPEAPLREKRWKFHYKFKDGSSFI